MASSGDGVPLESLAPAGERAVASLYALWGLSHLMICLLCSLVLFRYRAMIPLMFALLLVEQLGRRPLLQFPPIADTGLRGESPGISPFPYGFLALIIIGLAPSLRGQEDPRERD